MKLFAQVSALAILMASSLNVFASPPMADVTGGIIEGKFVENLAVFRGIPYAADPSGENRFRGPQPVEPWYSAVLDTLEYKPPCIQGRGNPRGNESEDCLYLNVATQKNLFDQSSYNSRIASKRPVMVWIHGGAWTQGSADGTYYDPAPLVNEGNVVLVKVSHRLGALGFAWHEALNNEPGALQGNYGLRDILQSLQWVQDNIHQFGGDPNNVTVFGESAGGWAICDLMASQYSSGLFHKAIIQSGGCPAWRPQQAQPSVTSWLEGIGCDKGSKESIAQCLRDPELKPETINRPQQISGSNLSPLEISAVIDGKLLTDNPLKVIEKGQHNAIPVIIGFNKNELPKMLYTGVTNAQSYTKTLEKVFYRGDDPTDILHDDIKTIRGYYNRYTFKDDNANGRQATKDAISELHSDIVFRCLSRRVANALVTTSGEPVYRYELTVPSHPDASVHAMDIPYLFKQDIMDFSGMSALGEMSFGSLLNQESTVFSNLITQILELYTSDQLEQQQKALQQTMLQSWTSFAETGTPMAQGREQWQPYANSNIYKLNAINPQMAASDERNEGCDRIDSVEELRYHTAAGRWNFLK